MNHDYLRDMKTERRNVSALRIAIPVATCMLWLVSCRPSTEAEPIATTQQPWAGEAISLLGDTLHPLTDDPDVHQQKTDKLDEAYARYQVDSTDLENIIWYARRLAYLHRYRDALDVLTAGRELHPKDATLLRHRGHRYITTRNFDAAIRDLTRAAQLAKGQPVVPEPDGIPNKLDIPLSNLQFNIYYHLGLAYYLKGEYEHAITAWKDCMTWCNNPDLVVATTDWLYLAMMRSGDVGDAALLLRDIHPDMEIIENDGYLRRLLVYKGIREPALQQDSLSDPLGIVTASYGISCWFDLQGRAAEAAAIRRQIITSGFWPAFGFIAAEADSARRVVQ